MSTPLQPSIPEAVLKRENRRMRASEILNRPLSSMSTIVYMALSFGLTTYLMNAGDLALPMWVRVVLAALAALTVCNTFELWTTRLRLEAAITLLRLQQDENERR